MAKIMSFLQKCRIVFFFLLLIPISMLTYEIRKTLVDTRDMRAELYILNMQRASNQRTILGLQTRILHYSEGHEGDKTVGCPVCFKNLMMERYDHDLIRKFLTENGVAPQDYMDGAFKEEDYQEPQK